VAESSRLLAFSLLGDLEVTSGGEPVALGGAKQRTLLALLLLARGRPVSSDTLIESLWIGSARRSFSALNRRNNPWSWPLCMKG